MTQPRTIRLGTDPPYRRLVGVGGIGTGVFLALEGDRTLGRNESRPARLLDVRDYGKLHIVAHHVAVLVGAAVSGTPFRVLPLGRVGDDDRGRGLLEEMSAVGIDTSRVEAVAGVPTMLSVCFQYPDGSGGNITTADSAAATVSVRDVDDLAALVDDRTIALAMPEVGMEVRRRLFEVATERGALRAASLTSADVPEAVATGLLGVVDLLAINEDEAAALAGEDLDPRAPGPLLDAVAAKLDAPRTGMRIVVTAGSRGAFAFEDGRWTARRPAPVELRSSAGAGDALLGGVLAALAAGVPLTVDPGGEAGLASALDLGVELAALSVTSPHTIHPGADIDAVIELAAANGHALRPPLADVV